MINKITGFIKEHEIITFVFITFLCSWIIWGIDILYRHATFLLYLGAFMPSIVSIVLTGWICKKKGIKQLLTRLTKWKFNFMYYIFVLSYFGLSYYISYLICKFIGYDITIYFMANGHYILFYLMLMLFIGGPLGEEFGWRGFLLPRLQKKLNPLYTSIIIGVIWSCWHLPLFFIHGTSQYGVPFPLFLFQLICFSVIITWIHNKTDDSLIFPILFHTAIDTRQGLMYGIQKFINLHSDIIFIVQLIIMILIICDMLRNKLNKVVNTNNYVL
ncbi:type II CAAX endopeptidase family protein [Clostridium sp.]|uniref:CPBP family intramembrane glutamic endopeptidase n=1 Tax=Clostridium sp. TaxID=1506 RepID=UPI002587B3F6|nr:type II CAAX endopeptidase family protein [Clostridium sp.]MDF2506071.1 Conserved rane protein [Clostridium sp.]